MSLLFRASLSLLVCALVASTSVDAAAATQMESTIHSNQFGLQVDRALGADRRLTTVSVAGQLQLIRGIMFDLEVAGLEGEATRITRAIGAPTTDFAAALVGNTTVGVRVFATTSNRTTFSLGAALSVPMSTEGKFPFASADERTLLARAALLRSGADLHRYLPETTVFRIPFAIEVLTSDSIRLRTDITPLFWSEPLQNQPETILALQHSGEMEVHFAGHFVAGLRAQAVISARSEVLRQPGKTLRLATSPFIGIEPPDGGLSARIGLLASLTDRGSRTNDNFQFLTLQLQTGCVF